jgi:hypothetical protein
MKGCKNCPAYAKCTVTYRGSACAALRVVIRFREAGHCLTQMITGKCADARIADSQLMIQSAKLTTPR